MDDIQVSDESHTISQRFTIGHDADGRWLVCDCLGLVGGVFVDRASAIRFAVTESGRHPEAVACLPDQSVLEVADIFSARKQRRGRRSFALGTSSTWHQRAG
ncbi:hypothetical protein [Oryzifoliimicrobium ureilyticus]|uniref:hypothetical protein n=1 Tax=Oryzifoliimicrobium ureilyticus TaxID=3113724 RepID=UPI0030765F88